MLNLSKLEAGQMEMNFKDSDYAEVVKKELLALQPLLKKKNLRFSMPIQSVDTRGSFDTGKVSQVVRNLLSNAIRFSPEAGKISVYVSEGDCTVAGENGENTVTEGISIIISDEGPGIPQDELEHIFDKFSQSSTTRSGVVWPMG